MTTGMRTVTTLDERVVFLREFLRHPRQIGSVTPSSRFLERRIVDLAEVPGAELIVELGAGTGGTTRAILASMAKGARLLTIEINPRFCALLQRIADPRFTVHCASATDLAVILSRHALEGADAIVSGIPFSTMDRGVGSRILATVAAALRPGGRFVAYQWSREVDGLSRPFLGRARVEVALLNLPPMRLYRWDKRNGAVRDFRLPGDPA